MALRLYLTNTAAGYTPATIRGTWNDKTLTGASSLQARKLGAGTTAAKAETSTTNNWATLLRRFVSTPLNNAATLDGAMTLTFGCLESNAAANMIVQIHMFVTVGSTDVVRGALTSLALGGGAEWPAPTISTSAFGVQVIIGAGSITPVAAQPGDRVVLEIGYRAGNTASTSYTGTLYYGATGSDLVVGSAQVTTQPGWMEFAGAGFNTGFAPPLRSGATVSNTGPVSSVPAGAGKRMTGATVTAAGPVSSCPAAYKVMKTITATHPVSTPTGSRSSTAEALTPLAPVSSTAGVHLQLAGAEALTVMAPRSIPYASIAGDIDYPPPDVELLTSPPRRAARAPLRFIAQDIRTHRWLDWDLPLINPAITYTLSGPTVIRADLRPEYKGLKELNLDPWATWIHAEQDGQILASGILQPSGVDGETYALEAIGVSGYAQNMPFLGDESYLEADPCDVIRDIWAHLTSYPDARLDVMVSPDVASKGRLGVPAYHDFDPDTGELLYDDTTEPAPPPDPVDPEDEPDPEDPPEEPEVPEEPYEVASYTDPETGVITIDMSDGSKKIRTPRIVEAKPYVLSWYSDIDCGREIDNLCKTFFIDYVERPRWNADRTAVLQVIELGYPRIGRKRFELRFALDENMLDAFPLREEPGAYASQVMYRGKGEGRAAVRGYAGRADPHRIRRVAVVTDQTLGTVAGTNAAAGDELLRRRAAITIGEIILDADHPNAPVGSYTVGDDGLILGDIPYAGHVELWHRFVSYTWEPDANRVAAQIRRSEQFQYGAPIDPPEVTE
jgi:hypothetical protein